MVTWSFRTGNVVAGARSHAGDLLDQIVERLVAGLRVELRGLDDQERRGVVVKEEMMKYAPFSPAYCRLAAPRSVWLWTRRSSTSVGACVRPDRVRIIASRQITAGR